MPPKMERRSSGLADLLGDLREPAPVPAGEPESAEKSEPLPDTRPHPATRPRGRAAGKAGKRSDPDYSLHGVLLRRETHLDATDLLRRQQEFPDLSTLMQSLLEGWVKKRKNR